MLTLDDIHSTAHAVVSILRASDMVACLVGSAAGAEHGISRIPNDVDILVLSGAKSMNPAEMKNLLVSKDSRFFLEKPVTNPNASYFILKYRLISSQNNSCCHVDIFLPGMIHLPPIPPSYIIYSAQTALPTMPFFPTLLHKVQAWLAHRASPKESARIKRSNDEQDISELLDFAVKIHKVKIENHTWLPDWFLQEAIEGVRAYVQEHPETAPMWKEIGFCANNKVI
ncbi:hypothetical protein JR316_0000448 [Psilocybe cubensis]|uniref:Uncharacterized protein n=2 Tax=Psilocybe cubensis TaxID=181762 RepID=A0ACB8HEX6_PSICU|nr:hypothetical protein JR316_0000448 [Psilocybe cubensis]KAH9486384.1 hypothetical protein JR316_0000448 [Psilocybe cubensis]